MWPSFRSRLPFCRSSFCAAAGILFLLLHGAGVGSPLPAAAAAAASAPSSTAASTSAHPAYYADGSDPVAAAVASSSPARPFPELAYVSFLYADSPEWLSGLTVLSKSLAGVGTTVGTLACLVTPDVSETTRRALLGAGFTDIVALEPHELIYKASPAGARAASRGFHTAKLYNKLHLFNLTRWKRIVFLDADTLVLASLDHLFALPCPPAGGMCAAAPDPFPPDRFNSGFMVIAPDAELFGRMLEQVPFVDPVDGSDQGFLQEWYKDWYAGPASSRLPFAYNCGWLLTENDHQFMRLRSSLKVDAVFSFLAKAPPPPQLLQLPRSRGGRSPVKPAPTLLLALLRAPATTGAPLLRPLQAVEDRREPGRAGERCPLRVPLASAAPVPAGEGARPLPGAGHRQR